MGSSIKIILLALLSRWIYEKVKNWKEARAKNLASGVEQPGVKIRLYFIESKKYVEIEGDAEAALKALDKIKEDDF